MTTEFDKHAKRIADTFRQETTDADEFKVVMQEVMSSNLDAQRRNDIQQQNRTMQNFKMLFKGLEDGLVNVSKAEQEYLGEVLKRNIDQSQRIMDAQKSKQSGPERMGVGKAMLQALTPNLSFMGGLIASTSPLLGAAMHLAGETKDVLSRFNENRQSKNDNADSAIDSSIDRLSDEFQNFTLDMARSFKQQSKVDSSTNNSIADVNDSIITMDERQDILLTAINENLKNGREGEKGDKTQLQSQSINRVESSNPILEAQFSQQSKTFERIDDSTNRFNRTIERVAKQGEKTTSAIERLSETNKASAYKDRISANDAKRATDLKASEGNKHDEKMMELQEQSAGMLGIMGLSNAMNMIVTTAALVTSTLTSVFTAAVIGIKPLIGIGKFLLKSGKFVAGRILAIPLALYNLIDGFFSAEDILQDDDVNIFDRLYAGIINVAANLVGGIIDGVAGLFGFETDVTGWVKEKGRLIRDSFYSAAQWVGNILSTIPEYISKGIGYIANIGSRFAESIKRFFFDAEDKLSPRAMLGGLVNIGEWYLGLWSKLFDGVKSVFNTFVEFDYSSLKDQALDYIVQVKDNVVEGFKSFSEAFSIENMKRLWSGSKAFVGDMLASLIDSIKMSINGLILSVIDKMPDIAQELDFVKGLKNKAELSNSEIEDAQLQRENNSRNGYFSGDLPSKVVDPINKVDDLSKAVMQQQTYSTMSSDAAVNQIIKDNYERGAHTNPQAVQMKQMQILRDISQGKITTNDHKQMYRILEGSLNSKDL